MNVTVYRLPNGRFAKKGQPGAIAREETWDVEPYTPPERWIRLADMREFDHPPIDDPELFQRAKDRAFETLDEVLLYWQPAIHLLEAGYVWAKVVTVDDFTYYQTFVFYPTERRR
jgi:hypothetical protein